MFMLSEIKQDINGWNLKAIYFWKGMTRNDFLHKYMDNAMVMNNGQGFLYNKGIKIPPG